MKTRNVVAAVCVLLASGSASQLSALEAPREQARAAPEKSETIVVLCYRAYFPRLFGADSDLFVNNDQVKIERIECPRGQEVKVPGPPLSITNQR